MARYDLTIEMSNTTENVSRVIIEEYVVITLPEDLYDGWDNEAYMQQMVDWVDFLKEHEG